MHSDDPRVDEGDLAEILALSAVDLRALADGHVLLTGGTGYIGRWLLEALCYANRMLKLHLRVTVLSRNPACFARSYPHLGGDKAVSLVEGDIRDFHYFQGEFSHAIHAATDVIATNPPLETFDVTVLGTRRFLDFCKDREVADVLLLSSGAVYGRIPEHIRNVPEDFCGAPCTCQKNSAYGIGKIATEWLGAAYSADGRMRCKSARIFAQVGPYLALDKQFAAGNFIRDALLGQPFEIKGDGTPRRSYMYGIDLAVWLLAILLRGKSARAYNVGSDVAVSIAELATLVARQADVAAPDIRVHLAPQHGAKAEYYVPDITRARNELGLNITVPLETALRRTIDWYRPLLIG